MFRQPVRGAQLVQCNCLPTKAAFLDTNARSLQESSKVTKKPLFFLKQLEALGYNTSERSTFQKTNLVDLQRPGDRLIWCT